MTTAVLVDDEANLLDYLADKLASAWPELDIAATAQNGREALALIGDIHPDVVFLDIHMPGLSGLQVAEQLADDVKIVFVTAFDQYAIEAFEAAAVDYLLKPVTERRLATTVERLKSHTPSREALDLRALIQKLGGNENSPYLRWLRAGHGETVQLIATADVVYFKSDHKYTSVMTEDAELVVRSSIKELAEQLDPDQFWRIHRGIIVNIAEVTEAKRDLRGRYTLKLKSRPESLRTSQSMGHLFKQM